MRFLTWLKSRFRRSPDPGNPAIILTDFSRWETFCCPATQTPREILENFGVDYATGITYINGKPLTDAELNKPISHFGITERYYICVVYPKRYTLRRNCRGRCPHRPEPSRNFPAR